MRKKKDQISLVDLMNSEMETSLRLKTLSDERRQTLRARMLDKLTTTEQLTSAPAPQGTTTIRAQEMPWTFFLPGVTRQVLYRDHQQGIEAAFYRLEPGAKIPRHSHSIAEECIVMSGEMRIGDHVVRAGDVHLASPGVDHDEMWAPHGALLWIRTPIYGQRRVSP